MLGSHTPERRDPSVANIAGFGRVVVSLLGPPGWALAPSDLMKP